MIRPILFNTEMVENILEYGVNGQTDMYIKHGHHHFYSREGIQIK